MSRSLSRSLLALLTAALCLSACSRSETPTAKSFVGKWKSSRAMTPVYMYENGEWEIKRDDGLVLQYGTWEFQNKKIRWSFKVGDQVGHDLNPVVSTAPGRFEVREADQSITTFEKIN